MKKDDPYLKCASCGAEYIWSPSSAKEKRCPSCGNTEHYWAGGERGNRWFGADGKGGVEDKGARSSKQPI